MSYVSLSSSTTEDPTLYDHSKLKVTDISEEKARVLLNNETESIEFAERE
jgi:hypothetical protein